MTPLKRLLLTFAVAVSAFVACSPAPAAGFVVQANGKALQRPTYAYVAPAVAKLGATIGRANVGAACDCSTQIVNGSTTYCALAGALPVQLAVCVPASQPAPPVTQTCWDGSVIAATSACPPQTPPHMHAGIAASDPSTWPVPQPGISTTLFDTEAWPLPHPAPEDWEADGAVRLICNWSKMAYIDPLVHPGEKDTSHHHTFFGNTGIDENTTVDNIRSKGNATCRGGTINLSGYWVPSVLDTAQGNVPIAPKGLLIYYKGGNCPYDAGCSGAVANMATRPSMLQPIPHGLRMLSGDATRSTAGGVGTWSCLMVAQGFNRPGTAGSSIPTNCQAGDEVWLSVAFPMCWDGKNLDSPDHRAHMAYDINGAFVAGKQWSCPADHPVRLPKVTYIVMYSLPTNPSDTAGWRLSSDVYAGPGGYSAHGDYMYGWDPVISDLWGTNCLAFAVNCGSTDLGDGRVAKEFQGN